MICKMVVLGEPISRFTHMLRMTLLCAYLVSRCCVKEQCTTFKQACLLSEYGFALPLVGKLHNLLVEKLETRTYDWISKLTTFRMFCSKKSYNERLLSATRSAKFLGHWILFHKSVHTLCQNKCVALYPSLVLEENKIKKHIDRGNSSINIFGQDYF